MYENMKARLVTVLALTGSRRTTAVPGSRYSTTTGALAAAHRRARDSLSAMVALGREGQGSTTAELGFVGVLLSAGDTGSHHPMERLRLPDRVGGAVRG